MGQIEIYAFENNLTGTACGSAPLASLDFAAIKDFELTLKFYSYKLFL